METLADLMARCHLQQYGMTAEQRDEKLSNEFRQWCDEHSIRVCVGCMRRMPGVHHPECRVVQ